MFHYRLPKQKHGACPFAKVRPLSSEWSQSKSARRVCSWYCIGNEPFRLIHWSTCRSVEFCHTLNKKNINALMCRRPARLCMNSTRWLDTAGSQIWLYWHCYKYSWFLYQLQVAKWIFTFKHNQFSTAWELLLVLSILNYGNRQQG